MRALCGAIITAGAMIGLGLTAMGIGTRYANYYHYTVRAPAEDKSAEGKAGDDKAADFLTREPDFEKSQVKIGDLDNPMKVCLTALVGTGLVGLAITFIGLAYHHHRRYHEHLHRSQQAAANPRLTV